VKKILLGILLLVTLTGSTGCGGNSDEDVYAVVIGKFTANSPQLEEGFYTAFLTGVPDNFSTVYFPKSHEAVYGASLFGEVNTFYLRLGNINGHDGWIVVSVKNSENDVGYFGQ